VVVINGTKKKQYQPGQVVDLRQAEGYPGFSVHDHTQLWQWRKHCKVNKVEYSAL
jgi:hypothetical protein